MPDYLYKISLTNYSDSGNKWNLYHRVKQSQEN